MTIPGQIYLTRKAVVVALGGRRQLEKCEAAGELHRVIINGYKIAHYRREEVVRLLEVAGSHKVALDRPIGGRETPRP